MFLNRIVYCFICLLLYQIEIVTAQELSNSKVDSYTPHNLIKPDYLKVGDTVAIVAPSGILNNRNKEINQAVALLKSWNLNVVVGEHVFSKANHFAGTDNERCEDFQKAMDNPNIKAIWCARGGYGTVRILDKLDYTKLKEKPKWLIGFSDITALHNQFHNNGLETIHAMMCTSLTDELSEIEETVS